MCWHHTAFTGYPASYKRRLHLECWLILQYQLIAVSSFLTVGHFITQQTWHRLVWQSQSCYLCLYWFQRGSYFHSGTAVSVGYIIHLLCVYSLLPEWIKRASHSLDSKHGSIIGFSVDRPPIGNCTFRVGESVTATLEVQIGEWQCLRHNCTVTLPVSMVRHCHRHHG